MKKIILIPGLFLFAFSAFSQYKWEYGTMSGAANYLGEIGGKEKTRRNFILDMKLSQTRFAVGGFTRYKLNRDVYIRGSLSWIRISGADNLSTNPGRVGRNLSFRNDLYEASLVGQYIFYDVADLGRTYRYRNDFKAYAFTGVTGFYTNPKAQYEGSWVALAPLHTEGQGIISDAPKPYGKYQVGIPAGAGFFFTFNKKYRIGWEFNWRTTFTDYLDDVSTNYPKDPNVLSPLGQALSNRNPELSYSDNASLPAKENYVYDPVTNPVAKRGDSKHNDSYLSTTINASYVIKGTSRFARTKYKTFFKGNKFKKRTIRAKF
ncbi:MAG: hypothetical protein HY840_14100 [Bacteroidetes bacterium]|nr:hypothetical protein [Bacteroidota bacterium]